MPKSVPCPCCHGELYATRPLTGDFTKHVSGAKIESDRDGTYMVCPHCQARVAFERDHGKMVVGPHQPCGPS